MTKHLSEAERRAQILAAARAEFMEQGFAAARVEDVARRARLSKGAVYFYFPSKNDLFMALVLEEHEGTYAFLDRAERSGAPALQKLLEVGGTYVAWAAGLRSVPRFFLMMSEQALREPDLRAECQAIHTRFVEALARILAQGITEGALRPLDPTLVAQLLKGMLDGFAGQAAIGIPVDPQRMADEGFRTVLCGILAQPERAEELLAALRPPSDTAAPTPR
jgi:AcrR family transcriptional regulator